MVQAKEKKSKGAGHYAFVTLLTDDSYLPGVQVLHYSLSLN
jgi:hypothetical protein